MRGDGVLLLGSVGLLSGPSFNAATAVSPWLSFLSAGNVLTLATAGGVPVAAGGGVVTAGL